MRHTYCSAFKREGRVRPLLHSEDTRSQVLVEESVDRGSRPGRKSRIASVLPRLVQELVLLGQMALQQDDAVTACSLLEASATLARQMEDGQEHAGPLSLLAWVVALQGNDAEVGILPEEPLWVPGTDRMRRRSPAVWQAGGSNVVAQGRAMMPTLTFSKLEPIPAPQSFVGSCAGLTAREMEVLRLVAQGPTDAQVAEQLVVSYRTVTTHLSSIYSKLGVSSRCAATRYAIEQDLV